MFKQFKPKEIYIPLTNTFKCAIIDTEDYDKVKEFKWNLKPHYNNFYAITTLSKKKYGKKTSIRMHRLILGLQKGDGKIVDHKNRNGLDNRKSNLRFCTASQNQYNIPPRNGYKGVSKIRNKYRAQIKAEKKLYTIGSYKTPEEAAEAYDKKALELHGEFAYTNF